MSRAILASTLLGAVALLAGCSADSPTPTSTPPPSGGGGSSLVLQLSASDASPKAGGCTFIGAFATLNGQPVPDGTSIQFTTNGGAFGQNGQNTISLTTQDGSATAILCASSVGSARVTGKVTLAGKTDSRFVDITFTDNGIPKGPFISQCADPSSGPLTGGTQVVVRGGGFCQGLLNGGVCTNTPRVLFQKGTTTASAQIISATDTAITILTPSFPAASGAATPVDVSVILTGGTGLTLTSPNCFTYAGSSVQPVVNAVLPSSGSKLGGTRVTIFGSGFTAPVQVLFGTQQAEIVSVAFDQIIAITPPANTDTPTGAVSVIVRNVACVPSGAVSCVSAGSVQYRYTVNLKIFGISPDHGNASTVVTITGQGFVAPLLVTFGGRQGTVVSVTGTQILARPPEGCDNTGAIGVTLLSTGETATSSGTFTEPTPTILTGPTPSSGPANTTTQVTVTGTNLGDQSGSIVPTNVIGGTVTVSSVSTLNGQQTVTLQITPDCSSPTVTFSLQNSATGCSTGTLTFTVNGAPTILSGPTPESGPAGQTTQATITGTNLIINGQNPTVTAPTGGTVTLVSAAGPANGTQTLVFDITPDSGCAASAVTFKLQTALCLSQPIAFGSIGAAPTIATGPTPASGPAGQATQVTITGTNFIVNGQQPTIIDESGGTVNLVSASGAPGGTQTLVLSITPDASCTNSSVSFKIQTATCTTQTLFFGSNGTAPTLVSGPVPTSGPIGVTTTGVKIVGTNFFPPGNPAAATVVDITNGTTSTGVTITNLQDNTPTTGQQTITLSITPDSTIGCSGSVSFRIRNTAAPGACQDSNLINFGATSGGPTVTSGPTPSSGPAGTAVSVTGTNFFRPGFPLDATIVNQSGGTVTISNRLSNGDGTETLILSISATNTCTGGLVSWQIRNTSIVGICQDSSSLSFTVNGTGGPTIISGPTPSSGPTASVTHTTVVGTSLFDPGNTAATTIVNKLPGGATVTIVQFQNNIPSAGQQTLNIDITPNGASCTTTNVSFQIRNATLSAGCDTSPTLNFQGLSPSPVVTSGPTPSSGTAGVSNINIEIDGTGFFPTGNPGAAQITAPSGGTAVITAAVDGAVQKLTLTITPAADNTCAQRIVTFMITNSVTGCSTGTISFIGLQAPTILDGPNPAAVPGSGDVVISGTNFFRSGHPGDASVQSVVGGTATIVSATDNLSTNSQTLTIHIAANNTCSLGVQFQIQNNFTNCLSNQTFVANSNHIPLAANFTQTNGAAGSGVVTFSSNTTGGAQPYTCSWVFSGGNGGPPTPATGTTCTTASTWDCGTGGPPCSIGTPPSATLTVTDDCGNMSTKTEAVSPP